MNYILPTLLILATSAQADQRTDAAQIEAFGQFTIGSDRRPEQVSTILNGCEVTIDTVAVGGDHAGELDHRDVFALTAVTFPDDGAMPPNYGTTFFPNETITEGMPIMVEYRADVPDAVTRTVAMWREPREPFSTGPTIDGIPYAIAPRQRGSFFLDGPEGRRAANIFVRALVEYTQQYCFAQS